MMAVCGTVVNNIGGHWSPPRHDGCSVPRLFIHTAHSSHSSSMLMMMGTTTATRRRRIASRVLLQGTPSGHGEQRPSRRIGVVIVDHGSKRAAANDMLDGVVEVYKSMVDSENVVCVTKAHMEIASPSIRDAVALCVDDYGVDLVVVAPFFLSRGRHIQEDIPRLVREAEEDVCRRGFVECVVAEPLGVDAGVVGVMKKRVDSVLENEVVR